MFQPARRLLISLGFAVSTLVLTAAPAAQAQLPYLQLPANQPKYAAIVVDAKTGEVLYAKRADSPRYPASITKVMTQAATKRLLQRVFTIGQGHLRHARVFTGASMSPSTF